MKIQANSGFTLVELMAGMVSAAVLALVFSAVLIFGYKGWTRLKAEAAMQGDADVAMRTMDRMVRVASNVTWSTPTLTLVLTNGVQQTFYKSASNLVWAASGMTTLLVSNRVGTFVCVVTNTSGDKTIVAVTLGLVQGSETLDMPFSIFVRN
jgi:type II secretory pathway pseudopilin PulG